ncbi:kelch-like protein 5 isoform X2 [Eurytemora carolleeae]|uniref:kelch-like protein 5 isoform X2 n=1 Tax=Eurytemora carolleeae TaxID=1294199 RepID=UPI000C76753F|nr:kelch-like protein 5 isoform X2 [Eurytemora carolleeae]|eukprot:XP_023321674.1 kelch-like protein 5 isoform X2 [Eurytemora affinis]
MSDNPVINDVEEEHDEFKVFENTSHSLVATRELQNMRLTGELIDCNLQVGDDCIPCHKAVLAANSPYFRALFRNQGLAAAVELSGMEFESIKAIIDYFYTGRIEVCLSTVSSLLSAADMLLIPWLVDTLATYLHSNINLYTVLATWRLARIYRLTKLERAAVNFCYSEFSRILESTELFELEKEELSMILNSDELIANEDTLIDALLRWFKEKDLDIDQSILNNIRFSLCSDHFIWRMENDEKYQAIAACEPFLQFKSEGTETNQLERKTRCRGTNDILAIHHDGSDLIYGYNTATEKWQNFVTVPEDGGYEYSCLTSCRNTLYLVGGRNKVRWYHGAVVINTKLYAVAGCGQLNTIEVLYLTEGSAMRWKQLPNLDYPRHMPGVGACKDKIYVVGGTDEHWTAQSTVEMFDTNTNEWLRLPDLQVPRIQPAVVGLNNKLYVMGGRNSNKVELMSVEVWDPVSHSWSYCKEMHRKRWGGGGGSIHNLLVIVGGRGKRAGQAELYSQKTNSWSLMSGDIPCTDRCYSATMVQKPWSWAFPPE